MGLLSTLAKIGGIAAAPFSGGASLALTAAGNIGDVLGKQAQGASQGRMTEAELLQRADALKNQQYTTAQGAQMDAGQLDLARQKFGTDNRAQLAKQALLGQLLGGGFQGTKIDIPGIKSATITGGLADSIKNNPAIIDAMLKMSAQARAAQDQPLQFEGGKVLNAPQLSAIPKASGWEKAAGIGGILGQLGGVIGANLPQQGAAPPMADSGASSQQTIAENLKRLVEAGVKF